METTTFGVPKCPTEPNIADNEKIALSLEFLGAERLLFRVPRAPATAYLRCFRGYRKKARNRRVGLRGGNGLFFGPRGETTEGGTKQRLRSTTPRGTKAKRHDRLE